MSNLALAKAALKKSMDKRVTHKPNVLEAEAKGTASKQAYEAKTGDIDLLDLNYLDSLNRITGTLKNTYMESISANKITSGTMLATALTLAGTEASSNKTTLKMIGDALLSVNDGTQDTLKISNTGLELRDGGESTSAAALIGRGISTIGNPATRMWPINNPTRRGWQMRSDGVSGGGTPQGYTRLIATRGPSMTPGNTSGWASMELTVEGNGPGYIAGYAGAVIQNMLWVVGPARITGSLDVVTNLRVANSSNFDGAVFLNAGISRSDSANIQFNRGLDINSGDLRFMNSSVQGIKSIGGVPLDLHAVGSFIRTNQSLRAIAGLVVTGATSLEGLSVSGSLTLPDSSITGAKLEAGAVGTSRLGGGAVTSIKIAANAVTSTELAGEAVGEAHLSPNIKDGGFGIYSARRLGAAWGGTATTAASGNHSHSTSFKELPKRVRKLILAARAQMKNNLLSKPNMRLLGRDALADRLWLMERLLLVSLHMHIEDPERTGEQREIDIEAGEMHDNSLWRYEVDDDASGDQAYRGIHNAADFVDELNA